MMRSLEFPDRTSFRIVGDQDEDEDEVMYRIYKPLVCLVLTILLFLDCKGWKGRKGSCWYSSEFGYCRLETIPFKIVSTYSLMTVGGGIKGVRPLVFKPPPANQRPIDHQGLSLDFITHLARENEIVRRPSSSSSSDNEEEVLEEKGERDKETEARFLEFADTLPTYTNSGRSIITSWQKGELLGRGSFGSVYEGISGDGVFIAVKEVSLLEQGSQAQECIQQLEGEIALLSQLEHQNIVRYRGTAKDGSNMYIFLELVSQGSLFKVYQRYKLRDSVVSMYTRQILDGLKYLHGEGYIHRDIKCANILVDASGVVKLADFGLAKVSKLNDIKSCKGTPFWMAPEVINPNRTDGYGSSADIWSLGCTVLEMLTGQIPYGDLSPVQAIADTLSLDGRDFIMKCLIVNPEERPTAAELLNHPFVRRPLSSSCAGYVQLGSKNETAWRHIF